MKNIKLRTTNKSIRTLFIMIIPFLMQSACNDKVEAERIHVDPQTQETYEIPKSNNVDAPFALVDGGLDKNSYFGTVVIWTDDFQTTKNLTQKILVDGVETFEDWSWKHHVILDQEGILQGYDEEYYHNYMAERNITSDITNVGFLLGQLSVDKRDFEVANLLAKPEKEKQVNAIMAQITNLKNKIFEVDANKFIEQRKLRMSEAKDWFENSVIAALPGTVRDNADLVGGVRTKFASFCEAQIFDLAVNNSFFMKSKFTERPSPNPLCEGVYAEKGLLSPETAACAPSEEAKDYFECLWREGVAKTDLFLNSYAPVIQETLMAWISTPNDKGLTLRDALVLSGNQNSFLNFNQIEGYCCFTKEKVTPALLMNANQDDPISFNGRSKSSNKRLRENYIFSFVFEDSVLFDASELNDIAKGDRISDEKLAALSTKYASLFEISNFLNIMTKRGGALSVYDLTVNAPVGYFLTEAQTYEKFQVDLLDDDAKGYILPAEPKAKQEYPEMFPEESPESVKIKEDAIIAIEQLEREIEAVEAEFLETYIKPIEHTVSRQVKVVLDRDKYFTVTDTTIAVQKDGPVYEYRIHLMMDDDNPWHQVCFDSQINEQVACQNPQPDMVQDTWQVSYDKTFGQITFTTVAKSLKHIGLFNLELEKSNKADKQFNVLNDADVAGYKVEIELIENQLGGVLGVMTGMITFWDLETNQEHMKGSIDMTNFNFIDKLD